MLNVMKCIYREQDNPKELVKYFSDSDVVIDSIFKNKKIRFTQPAALNDPLEFNPILIFPESVKNAYKPYICRNKQLPSVELFCRIQLIESVINNYGILSLSSEVDSFDMWNLYSNGHKGFLIQFKDNFNEHKSFRSTKEARIYKIGKLEYVDILKIELKELVTEENYDHFEYIYETLFFSKSNRWEHEHEYRIVRKLSDHENFTPINKVHRNQNSIYLFDFPLECIDSIAFGAQMTIANKIKIINACKNMDIQYYQSVVFKDEIDRNGKRGHVHYFSIADNGSIKIANLENLPVELLCSDSNTYTNLHNPISVKELKSYPLFRKNKTMIRRLFNNL